MEAVFVIRHYLVAGRVQGVGYRRFAQKQAQAIGLKGVVRNLQDGRVEIVARGPEKSVRPFEAMLAKGPKLNSGAEVSGIDRVDIPEAEAVRVVGDFSDHEFEIVPDGVSPWAFLIA